jgi:hypothetical protein
LVVILKTNIIKLQKDLASRCFTHSSLPSNRPASSLYLLKGNDQRTLSSIQASEIDGILQQHQPHASCLLYNPTEAMRKLNNWNAALPWIKPHYAVKSNPAMPLLNDLQAQNIGFDCASRTEL